MSDNPKNSNTNDNIAAGENGNENGNGAGNGVHHAVIGFVRPTDIIQEVQVAYLDYAMSVIVARALPDVRDGLKPVHRRILYAMWHDLSLTHDKPHKKSARIVGEVLGKYHPHGDAAVYDAMVRMAQPFSLRYTLIDGQGNFGSVDGDNAAAMRYTEARLAEISDLMLEDLEKDTVGWHPNFDNTLREPDILPAALPNLLINGSSGIAVGMATNIPPHNLGEVVDALAYAIDHYHAFDDITIEQLMQFIKGPDFPTGGIVYRYREEAGDEGQIDVIAQGYSVGKSRLVLQAKAHFEETARGRTRIVVTELPYQTNKTTLIERIADLVREGKIEGISDLRDESDRTGMRVLIELTRGVDPKAVLKDLYKYTPLQQTFGMQLLALVDGQPRLLTLKRMLQLFIQHREEIIRRRSEFDLARARERAHIVEGLLRTLDILDEVIQTIRKSQTVETARRNLVANFKFTEVQAQAILDMQLRRLAALERKKLQEEHDELRRRIAYLEDLLKHPDKILALIKSDLLEIKAKYGDARRTQIVDRTKGALTTTDLLPDHQVWVAVSKDGDLRRQDATRITPAALRQAARDGDLALLSGSARDFLYLFTQDGRAARVSVHEIPADGAAKNAADLTGFTRRDKLGAALVLPRTSGADAPGYVFFATVQGQVKRVTVADLAGQVQGEFPAMKVEDKDRLGWALQTAGDQDVLLVTSSGQAIRFAEEEVRSMGLPAGGVGGIRLGKGETVVAADVADAADTAGALLTLTAHGFAKQSLLADYPRQGRNGGGVVTHKTAARTGPLAAALIVPGAGAGAQTPLAVLMTKATPRLLSPEEVPVMGRGVLGKQVVAAGDGVLVAGVRRLVAPAPTGPGGGEPPAPPKAPRPEPNVEAKPPPKVEAPAAAPKKVARPAQEKSATPAPSPRAKASSPVPGTAATPKRAPQAAGAVTAPKAAPPAKERTTAPAATVGAVTPKAKGAAVPAKAKTAETAPVTRAKAAAPAGASATAPKSTAGKAAAAKTAPQPDGKAQAKAKPKADATTAPAAKASAQPAAKPPAAKEPQSGGKAAQPDVAAPKAARAAKEQKTAPKAGKAAAPQPARQAALFAVETADEPPPKAAKAAKAGKLQAVTSVKRK